MALSRFVVTNTVTVALDALATPVADEPGTGGAAGFGSAATIVAAAGSQGKYGLPGMPDFMRLDDVCATYESMTGHAPRDMEWYTLLAATRHGVVSLRTGIRGVRFDGAEMPDDVDDLIMHRTTLEQMLDRTYWKERS